jgi:hypothetical protein
MLTAWMEVVAAPVSIRLRKERPASCTMTTSVGPTILFSVASAFGRVRVRAASRNRAGIFCASRLKNVMRALHCVGLNL